VVLRLTPPSSGRPQARCARLRPPLMSNVSPVYAQRDSTSQLRERYAQWESSAPAQLLVLVVVVAISAIVHMPSWQFVAVNVVAGIAVFFCWQLAIASRQLLSIAVGCVGLVCAMVGLGTGMALPLALLFTQGIGTIGASLALCFLLARYAARG